MSEKIVTESMQIAFANWILEHEISETKPLVDGLCWSLLCHSDVISERWCRNEIAFSVATTMVDKVISVLFMGVFQSSIKDMQPAKKSLAMLETYLRSCFHLWQLSTLNVDNHPVVVGFEWSLQQPFKIKP